MFEPIALIPAGRVAIRPVAGSDLADLLEVNGDAAVTRFLPYATWTGSEDASAWLTRIQTLTATGTGQQLVIEHLADRKVIGAVLLFRFEASSARVELGYVLGRKYWRQGLASEALRAVCTYAFLELGIRRIEAEVNPDNSASNAVIQALGFVREGLLRKRWVDKGIAYDTILYGCLAEEWPAGIHRS
jgi:[ribosomal protein S5]-alanine N-acetyltransferase